MWEKIKNLLISVEGVKLSKINFILVQVQGLNYIDQFTNFLRDNNFNFTFITEKNCAVLNTIT